MRRKKGRIPKRDKVMPGQWHRDAWFSVAYAGTWSLRVHHKRAGWRAHIRRGSLRLWDLPSPAATRAEAENAVVEAGEVLCAEVSRARERHEHGETVALIGADIHLGEIRAALGRLA